MSEFDQLLERLKRAKTNAEEFLQKVDKVIEALEAAKEIIGVEQLEQLTLPFKNDPNLMRLGQTEESINQPAPRRLRSVLPPEEIAQHTRKILLEKGKPMKRGELVSALEERQVPLVGKDKNKNLGTILWRHQSQFVHLDKLGYWLRDVSLPGVYTAENEH